MRYSHGTWSLGTSGVSYLDTVAVNHEGCLIDTWQKAKKWFARWHEGDFLLIWEDGRSFKVFNISIKKEMNHDD